MPDRSPLSPDRFFSAEPGQRKIARQLYDSVFNLPLVCPCVNLDPRIFVDRQSPPPNPCEALIFSDEYIMRRFNSLGVDLRGDQRKPRNESNPGIDYRKIWQYFVEKSILIRGLPADVWLSEILFSVFGIKEKLALKNAMRIYDSLEDSLSQPDFQPVRLFERFNIETIGVSDSPANPCLNALLPEWKDKVIPCFNADLLFELHSVDWPRRLQQLEGATQTEISTLAAFTRAIQTQRVHFKSSGATTFVQSICCGEGEPCTRRDVDSIFQRALRREVTANDALHFSNYMLHEMATLSLEDNLVIHLRQDKKSRPAHLAAPDGDYPPNNADLNINWVKQLLARFGVDSRLTIILVPEIRQSFFNLENCYREFPSVRIGTPDWFFNGLSSMQEYFGTYVENLGAYKTAGLNSSTGSLWSLPAQHDIWRRSSANWLAKLVSTGLVDLDSAYEILYALSYDLVKSAYHLK